MCGQYSQNNYWSVSQILNLEMIQVLWDSVLFKLPNER